MVHMNRTFRIFVSSTFSDLKEERDALQKYVFPRLNELCNQYGCRFQAIDLRWGVSEESALDQQTMKICLGEIERSQRVSPKPNFLILLGNRYGWRPLPAAIPENEYREILRQIDNQPGSDLLNNWYKRDDNALPPAYCLRVRSGEFTDYSVWERLVERPLGEVLRKAAKGLNLTPKEFSKYAASATEQEIHCGALEAEDASDHVFCFFRNISGMPEDARAKNFLDYDEHLNHADKDARVRVETLKDTLKNRLPGNWSEFESRWENGKPSTEHIGSLPETLGECLLINGSNSRPTNFCEEVWLRLSKVIRAEMALIEKIGPLEKEVILHDSFREERSRFFTGREESLRSIIDYIRGDSLNPLVIAGASGSGKSALMAKAVEYAQTDSPGSVILSRFIGVTPASSDARSLLESLYSQIARQYGQDEKDIPAEYKKLVSGFFAKLQSGTSARPLVIFIDALDQLSNQDNGRNLAWLPSILPANAKIIVSTLVDDCYQNLKRRLPANSLTRLEPLRIEEGKHLLEAWLSHAGRTLQPVQEKAVLENFRKNGLPLYLKLAFEEARNWHSYTGPEDTELHPDIPGIIEGNLLPRLSKQANHGPVMVARSLGYIAASRYGLSEDEILEILSADSELMDDFRKSSKQALMEDKLPVVVWSRLYFDLEPYLTERNAGVANVLTFYHRQLAEAVSKIYLSGERKPIIHGHLARYFGKLPLWIERKSQRSPNLRKVSEQPYQQALGKMWPDLVQTLAGLEFMEAKCTAGMTYDLSADYARVLENKSVPGNQIREISEYNDFVLAHSHILSRNPEQTFQQAANHPDGTLPAREGRRLLETLHKDRLWLKRVNKPQSRSACRMTLAGHSRSVNACAFSPDGSRAASGSDDRTLKLWDVDTGLELASFLGYHAQIRSLAFSPDGRRIAVALNDPVLRILDAESGNELLKLAGHYDSARCCAFSPDGSRVASCSEDMTVKVWDAESGTALMTLYGHDDFVNTCAFSPDGKRIVTGAYDNTLKIWDAESGTELTTLVGHSGAVVSCAFSPDGGRVVSASLDNTLKVWNAVSGDRLFSFAGHQGFVNTCAFSPDGGKIASGSSDHTLRIWDAESGAALASHDCQGSIVNACAFSPDGRLIVTGLEDKTLKIWDAESGQGIKAMDSHQGWVRCCAFSTDGRRILTGSDDNTLKIWDACNGEVITALTSHSDAVDACAFSPDGSKAVSGSWDGTVKIWDVAGAAGIKTLKGHHDRVRSCAFSPAGRRFATGSDDKTLKIRDVESGAELKSLAGHAGSVNSCAYSTDGKSIVSASDDKTLRIWDAETGALQATLKGHLDAVINCAFSPNGDKLASCSFDKTLRLWDVKNGSMAATFEGDGNGYRACAFFPDNRHLLTGSYDNTLRIWDTSSEKMIYQCLLESPILCVCMDAAGENVVAGCADGRIRILRVVNLPKL